ncbi:MAG: 4a-hydroxytetrahydrobiopterin dehydratase [Deltaproteobacteria bacterium]|nr:4a-hydroxytetrahydrobiopterin dehydratase [Deltaproteobacteria bacterium]
MPKLAPFQISAELKKLSGWSLVEGRLYKEFRFDTFPTAVVFVNNLVDPAEELDHHPDIAIKYNRVQVSMITHAVGGITEKDFALAKRIDELT